ncbi:FAD-binding oxidoreductase [Bradyrhizobium sp. LHD-71]|uniref:FAD-binding oxidoreductase n=1 Tax=Bradyrhizobium sp. LHD-71 TaxID=3072141 RepID=UPI00280CBC3A|nr:FAD-binding oxidoreductase [Bradyrhizobium sp. LHD-71]MDQ8731466.1 FAD-binding oxidoreductase [Bradyrhizobium sp. LHD-71]
MNRIEPTPKRLTPDLIGRFKAIVGEKYAVTDPHDIAAYVTEERMLYHGHSQLVLRPGSTPEVSAICKLANETQTPLVPQGGNTGLVGGQTPHHGEVVVSLRRMDRVRDLDPQSNTMTCESGMVLLNAQKHASEADRLFPLSLGAEGSCTIGGNLSTNAGGNTALAYGVARDLVIGLEVVLADGRVLNALSKLKKDNTGYNLHNLFIGAEGTLGIITAAVLKLFPKPRAVETAFIGLKSPKDALALLGVARAEASGAVTSFELVPEIVIEFCVRHGSGIRDPMPTRHPWYVLMELTSPAASLSETMETILSRGMEEGLVEDAVIATSLQHRRSFWDLRDFVTHSQKPEGGSIKHDVSVPVASVPEFLDKASAAVVRFMPGARVVPFGHLGDGNIHFNISQPIGADKEAFLGSWRAMNDVVHGVVAEFGGSISAEHGIGYMKRDELAHVKDPVALQLMRQLKATLDPNGILNPGKVV